MKIRIRKKKVPFLNEALTGLHLPDIINTKIMEEVTINAKAQEVYGKIIRDTLFRWRGRWFQNKMFHIMMARRTMAGDSEYILDGVNESIFNQFIKNNIEKAGLTAKDDEYGMNWEKWVSRLNPDNPDIQIGADADWAIMVGDTEASFPEGWEDEMSPTRARLYRRRVERDVKRFEGYVPNGRKALHAAQKEYVQFRNELKDVAAGLFEKLKVQGGNRRFVQVNRDLWVDIRRALKSTRKKFKKWGFQQIYEDEIVPAVDSLYLMIWKYAAEKEDMVKIAAYLNRSPRNHAGVEKAMNKAIDNGDDILTHVVKFLATGEMEKSLKTSCEDVAAEKGSDNMFWTDGTPCVIKKYDDGHFWFNRASRNCEAFGTEGRNCGSGAYLLIDLQKMGDTRTWHIGLDYDPNSNILHQVLSKGNVFPVEKYWPYIKDFVEKFGVKDIEVDAFTHSQDSSPSQIAKFMTFVMGEDHERGKEDEALKEIISKIDNGEYNFGIVDSMAERFRKVGKVEVWGALRDSEGIHFDVAFDSKWQSDFPIKPKEWREKYAHDRGFLERTMSEKATNLIEEWWNQHHHRFFFNMYSHLGPLAIGVKPTLAFSMKIDMHEKFWREEFPERASDTGFIRGTELEMAHKAFTNNGGMMNGIYYPIKNEDNMNRYIQKMRSSIFPRQERRKFLSHFDEEMEKEWADALKEVERQAAVLRGDTDLAEVWKKNANIKPKKKINVHEAAAKNNWYRKRQK